jgi:two-component system sensor histidine kinase RegB
MRNQLLIFRLLTGLGQLGLLSAGNWLGFSVENPWVWWVSLVYLLLVLVSHFWRSRHEPSKWLLLLDLAVWIAFFALLNGISNPLIWCLILPIMLSGISQGIVFTWLMVLLSNLSYVLLWWIQPMTPTGMHSGHEPFNSHIFGMWIGFVLISNLLAYITTQLMKTIRDQNRQLVAIEQQRAEDQHIMTMATMATGLAHELGTPLNSIKLLAGELSNTDQNEKTRLADIKEIDNQVARCQSTIREMAELANDPEYLNSRLTNLNTLLHDLRKQFHQNHSDITVNINSDTDQQVVTDALLELALLNILNNSATAKARVIHITSDIQANQIRLKINDNGMGQAFNSGSGLGIGLTLSRRILRSAGGGLTLKRDQHGAEATVILARVKS